MTAVSDFVDAVRRQQRAARHTASLALLVHGLAMVGLVITNSSIDRRFNFIETMVPVAVYSILWMLVRLRRRVLGMGSGREGFGVLALIFLVLGLLLPVTSMAVFFVGAGTFLGVGLAVIGARLRTAWVWSPGIALIAACPVARFSTIEDQVRFLGPQTGTVVLTLLAAVLLMLAGSTYVLERATLMVPPQP